MKLRSISNVEMHLSVLNEILPEGQTSSCLGCVKFVSRHASAWLNLENHARWGCVCGILCENLPEGQEKLPTGKLVLAWLCENLPV